VLRRGRGDALAQAQVAHRALVREQAELLDQAGTPVQRVAGAGDGATGPTKPWASSSGVYDGPLGCVHIAQKVPLASKLIALKRSRVCDLAMRRCDCASEAFGIEPKARTSPGNEPNHRRRSHRR